jgi:phage tail sheath protein FI
MAGFGDLADSDWHSNVGTAVTDGADYQRDTVLVKTLSLTAGTNSAALGTAQYATGFDRFEDKDQVQVDFLIAPGMGNRTDHTTVVNDLIAIAQGTRKDCVVVASPARSDVVTTALPNPEIIATAKGLTFSSYLFMDNNYLKVYDKYNDQYIKIPAASSTAGIMAASDNNTAAWYSPAGQRRGAYLGITSLVHSPNKSQRDLLYRNGVNPIANIPGQGVLLYGDKTHLARPSAFDRINVRRLFLVIERAIAIAARNVLFEFNDEFTRAEFTNVIEPFLREIQGRRGITDFRVVADETNNTAAVIDRNEFVCSIFIKPARSINFVTLNFVAVRTGVDFDEVVGTV